MFELPELPFSKDAFSKWASAETFDYHHGKHHAGYVNKLNAVVLGTDFEDRDLEYVVRGSRGREQKVFNLAGQHFNHSFFWNCLSPKAGDMSLELSSAIDRDFGSFENFQLQFVQVATGHFGSGWAWLVKTPQGKLEIRGYHDADTPAFTEDIPLLTLDVWEHAYYIDHRNDRGTFIEGFWEYVNWGFVSQEFEK